MKQLKRNIFSGNLETVGDRPDRARWRDKIKAFPGADRKVFCSEPVWMEMMKMIMIKLIL